MRLCIVLPAAGLAAALGAGRAVAQYSTPPHGALPPPPNYVTQGVPPRDVPGMGAVSPGYPPEVLRQMRPPAPQTGMLRGLPAGDAAPPAQAGPVVGPVVGPSASTPAGPPATPPAGPPR